MTGRPYGLAYRLRKIILGAVWVDKGEGVDILLQVRHHMPGAGGEGELLLQGEVDPSVVVDEDRLDSDQHGEKPDCPNKELERALRRLLYSSASLPLAGFERTEGQKAEEQHKGEEEKLTSFAVDKSLGKTLKMGDHGGLGQPVQEALAGGTLIPTQDPEEQQRTQCGKAGHHLVIGQRGNEEATRDAGQGDEHQSAIASQDKRPVERLHPVDQNGIDHVVKDSINRVARLQATNLPRYSSASRIG